MKPAPVSFSFTSQLATLKNTLILWEDVVAKAVKLSASLRSAIHCIAGFLEAFQKVADSAYSSNCGLRDLGLSMTRFCLRERGLESRLRTFNSQLQDCLASPLADRLEEWRRTVVQLDRENNKDWRRARSELQRVTYEFDKLNKRFRRKGSSGIHNERANSFDGDSTNNTGDNVQLNFVQQDLDLKRRTMSELERNNLRRAVVEERRRFAELVTCLKPVLDCQLAVFSDAQSIEECVNAISKHACDPNDLTSDTEQAIEEAVAHASTKLNIPERKFSEVRAAMRFGRHHTGSDFSRSTLSGHSSQLSLQSTVSSSNSYSWNAIAAAAAAASSNLTGTRSPSPHRAHGVGNCVSRHSDAQLNGYKANVGPSVDVLSLFDSGDANVALSCDSGRQFEELPENSPIHSVHSAQCDGPAADPDQTVSLGVGDPDDEDGGGGTTEDTEDGETEDEERVLASGDKDQDESKPILYPNQAIPAPVYTNLNELKRAAARKFSLADSGINGLVDSRQSVEHPTEDQIYSTYSIPHPDTTYGPTSVPNQPEASLFDSQCPQLESLNDGLISTTITSGTSTFRRSKPLNGQLCNASVDDSLCRQSIYGSVTPGLARRGGQNFADVSDGFGGRSRSARPAANPPRRSSSVSRDLSHLRHSTADHFTGYPYRNMPQLNNVGPGIQRVSSSILTPDYDGFQAYPDSRMSGSRNGPSKLTQVSSGVMHGTQYASVCAPSSHSSGLARAERMSSVPRLTPPPLATAVPVSSKNNQLMFGIKVLPNHTQMANNFAASSQYGRLPQRFVHRQASCDPGMLYPPSAVSSAHGLIHLPNAAVPRHESEQARQSAMVFKDDGVTSFID